MITESKDAWYALIQFRNQHAIQYYSNKFNFFLKIYKHNGFKKISDIPRTVTPALT